MEAPKLVTLIPEDEEDEPEILIPGQRGLAKKLVVEVVAVVVLKVALGYALKRLSKTINQFTQPYPEDYS